MKNRALKEKILCTIATFTLILVALVGCGKKDDQGSVEPTSEITTQNTLVTEATTEKVTEKSTTEKSKSEKVTTEKATTEQESSRGGNGSSGYSDYGYGTVEPATTEATTQATTEQATTEATTETTTQATTEQMSETTTESATEETTETTTEDVDREYPVLLSLSGKAEDEYITKEFSYIILDKCVLLFDKEIRIPGNFALIIDDLVDTLEEKMGIVHNPKNYVPCDTDFMSWRYGYNIWEDVDFGDKLVIYFMTDTEDVGYISNAGADEATIVQYYLFSDDLWNAIPSYKDNDWRRGEGIDYSEIAHEVSHSILLRNTKLNSIMIEGSAEYYGLLTVQRLAEKYSEVEVYPRADWDYEFPEEITSDNAERLFRTDYTDLSYSDRGAEYTYGKYLCRYLNSIYGPDFFKDIVNYNIKKKIILTDDMGEVDDAQRSAFTDAMKKLFGDTLFVDFGEWYQDNKQ